MEQDSHSDVFFENYYVLHIERPPWSTRNPPSRWPNFHINFSFSCESLFTEWIELEVSPVPHLSSQHSQPEADAYIVLNSDQFMNNGMCRKIMARGLGQLPLTDSQCEDLIFNTMEQAAMGVRSMPSHHNVLNLHLRVHIMHECTIRRASNRVMQEWFDAAALKVPAAEAAVEMVMKEKVELNETETCTICLEEVREAVRMPCSHVFHGDCIGKWLRMDHCCPLCRFQMPVAEEVQEAVLIS